MEEATVKRTISSEKGMSLVEATIVLMVIATLTSVLSPSIRDYVDDARQTKAKEDCEAIGVSIARLLMDTGAPFALKHADKPIATRYRMDNRIDLLVSTGDVPAVHPDVQDEPSSHNNINNTVSWQDPLGHEVGSLYDQLVSNEAGYIQPTVPFDTSDPQPPVGRGLFGFGWRGAYLSPTIGPDPWGFRYAVNSVYLGTAIDADKPGQGQHGRGWAYDTFCVSAGLNAQLETNFEDSLNGNRNGGTSFDEAQNGAADDIVYTISGYGR